MRCRLIIIVLGFPVALAAQADSAARDSNLVERTKLGASSTMPERTFRTFMNDTPEHLFGLVPGVVLRGTETGMASASALSIRGGTYGEASVYIDGAPVRFNVRGFAGLGLTRASVAAATLTTGPPDLALSDLRDGVIEYETRSGSDRFFGTLSAATDEAFMGVGYNRFEAAFGGPLPVQGATWFVGATVSGQRSHYVGIGSEDVPSYIPAGTDTVIMRPDTGGQTLSIPLPLFTDQRAYDWGSELRGHARIDFVLGPESRLSLTGVVNETQERFFPENFAVAPSLYRGARSTGRLLVANWHQQLGNLSGKPLLLRVNASIGSNRDQSGLLDPASEAASADPALGITLETLRFTGADSIPYPVTDQLVRNLRTNSGLRVPYLNRDDLRLTQESRANPYGMETSWPENGVNGVLTMVSERRAEARWAFDWQAQERHSVTVGGSFSKVDLSNYQASLVSQFFMDAYLADPSRAGIYLSDQFTFGELRGKASLRFDHFESVGLFADVPGRIYTNPEFNRLAAIATDTGYINSVNRVMTPGKSRNALSWRLGAERSLGTRATGRVAMGQWVEPPTLGFVLRATNSDLDFTNTNDLFGRDVEYGHASLIEIGAQVAIAGPLTTDVAFYRATRPVYTSAIQSFNDPANPGDIVNVNSLTKAKDMVNWGGDAALDWRPGSWLTTRVVYSVWTAEPTTLEGPSEPTDLEVVANHSLSLAAVARAQGGPLRGLEVAALLRAVSGLPYTRLDPFGGTGVTALQTYFGFGGFPIEPRNSSRLPWTHFLDLRVTKSVNVGALNVTGFADFRNALNITNVLDLYAETGDVENATFRAQRISAELGDLEREASDNNRLLPNGDIDLIPNCASWTVTSGSNGAVVNCVALQRVEARFGNGDGLYSRAERETALNTFFNALYGPQTFYGSGRSVRLGVELRW